MIIRNPRRCIIGTIGMPGDRTFYWQIAYESEVVSVKIEKQQATVIAEQVDGLLDEMKSELTIPPRKSKPSEDTLPLELPIDNPYELLSLGIYVIEDEIQLELKLLTEDNNIQLQVRLSPMQGREFCARTRAVVAAGRSSCPFCEKPIDVDGHICVRANGYRR